MEEDFRAEAAQLDAGERHEVWESEQAALLAQWAANKAALQERQRALLRPAVEWVYQNTSTYPLVSGQPDAGWAMGVVLSVHDSVRAVICPVAGRITPEVAARLLGTIVFVECEQEGARVARACRPGQRLLRVDLPPANSSSSSSSMA